MDEKTVWVSPNGPDAFESFDLYERSLRFSFHARPNVKITRKGELFEITDENGKVSEHEPNRVTIWKEVVHL